MLYQLRQVRSKFFCLSTYTLCRSVSSTSMSISYKPYSIWTLCKYDSHQKADSQSKKVSKLSQKIAVSLLIQGQEARMDVETVVNLYNSLKPGAIRDTVSDIIDMVNGGSHHIINNLILDRRLQVLAASMTSAIANANQTAAKLVKNHTYK